jgi:hypothetical protein
VLPFRRHGHQEFLSEERRHGIVSALFNALSTSPFDSQWISEGRLQPCNHQEDGTGIHGNPESADVPPSGTETEFAFWPSDCGRRAAARKAPAFAALRARGLAEFFSNAGLLRTGRKELRARTVALSRRLPAGISSARRQTRTGGPRPRPEREIMTGTLEQQHLDPTTLVIGLSARYG